MNTLTLLGIASMVFVAAFTYHAAFVQAHVLGQSPRSAIIEAWLNILVGFSINFAINQVIIPLAVEGGHLSYSANFWMGWLYTTVSIARQYVIRRWFNGKQHGAAPRLGSAA